jgi:hypothetical protein
MKRRRVFKNLNVELFLSFKSDLQQSIINIFKTLSTGIDKLKMCQINKGVRYKCH